MTHELSGASGGLQETGMSAPAQLARPNSSLWFILVWTATSNYISWPVRTYQTRQTVFLFVVDFFVLQGYLFYYRSYFFLSIIQHFTESMKNICTICIDWSSLNLLKDVCYNNSTPSQVSSLSYDPNPLYCQYCLSLYWLQVVKFHFICNDTFQYSLTW